MADFFGKGIGVAAGFDLGAAAPLDTRTVVTDMDELQAHIDGGRTYEGMMVYVESEGKMYMIGKPAEGETAPKVEEFGGFDQESFDQAIGDVEQGVADLEAADEEIKGRLNTLEGLVVGGEGEGLQAVLGDVADLKATLGNAESGLIADVADAKAAAEAAQGTADQAVQDASDAKAAADAAQDAADQAQSEVDALEGKVAVLEAINHEAYITADEQVLAGAKEHAQGLVDGEKERAEAAEAGLAERLTALEGKEEHKHDNKVVLDGITAEKVAAWDGAEQAAKDYADGKIAELVGSAPELLDTLGELADAIEAHEDVYETYVGTVTAALESKVDKVEGSRLVSEEEIAAFEGKADVADVEAAQQAAEKHADDAVASAVTELSGEISKLETDLLKDISDAVGAAKQELQGAIEDAAGDADAAAKAAQDAADAAQGTADQAVQDAAAAKAAADAAQGAADDAQAAAEAAQAEVDALEEVVGAPSVDGSEATGIFAEIAALKAKDVEIDEKNAAQDTRLALVEEQLGLGGGEGGTSAVEQFANDIAGLKSHVGAPAEGETPATGLFAEIAALKSRDGELQSAIDAEASRAKGVEEALAGRMDNAEESIAKAQVDIATIQDTLNANVNADAEVKGRVSALEGVVGKAAEGEAQATGLFAEIAALVAKNAAQDAKDAELEAAIGKPAGEGQAATGVYAHIVSLHDGVANTFASLKSEIKEDGKLYTLVGEETITTTDVPVMGDTDIEGILADILGTEE